MAKDANDVRTAELNLTVTRPQAVIIKHAINMQIKSHERAARAQRDAGREAVAESLQTEITKLQALLGQLG